jgi:hypothetical protein
VKKPTTKVASTYEVWDDPLLAEIRPAVREAIEKALEQELIRTLDARWYGRAESRVGHRKGTVVREIGTPMGPSVVEVPRARVFGPDGAESEWRSAKLPRHARRLKAIDQVVVVKFRP